MSGATAPPLSVVVASVNGLPYLDACLSSLAEQAPDAEVVVADWTDERTRRHVRERFPKVKLLSFDEPKAVPELRAAGIADAAAPYVAVIEDHCVVRAGWAESLLAQHAAGHAVVGGPVRNGATRRLRDWAPFFVEYAEHMEPLPDGPAESLTGMNVSYDRAAIASMDDLLRQGMWETWLHPHLAGEGFGFHSDSRATLVHLKDFGFREFCSQRWHYARSHAGMRNAELGSKRVLYVLGAPLIVPLMYSRIARTVFRKRRHRARFLAATPLVLVYLSVWAAGEAVGSAFGGGRSILRVR
ncbi:MAG: glycosyltransferase family 2 protein [Solirubrobacterales bacterium]|nr:glycosyltransferase family 2 protein [Solirubrobacterales bacterium]